MLDNIQSSSKAKYKKPEELPLPQVQIAKPSCKKESYIPKSKLQELACKEWKLYGEETNSILTTSPSNTIATFHESPLNLTFTKETKTTRDSFS